MRYLKVLCILLMVMPSFGQIKPRFFEYGPKAGFNISGISTFDTITYKKKLSMLYQVGAFARFNYKKFSLQPELVYQVKGAKFTSPQAKYNFKYLSTPLLFGYTPLKGIYFETGPEVSWALNQNYKKEGYTVYGPEVATEAAWIIGARINMLDAFSLASMNIRYTMGLTNTKNSISGYSVLDHRTRVLQLTFTYTLSEYLREKRKLKAKKK